MFTFAYAYLVNMFTEDLYHSATADMLLQLSAYSAFLRLINPCITEKNVNSLGRKYFTRFAVLLGIMNFARLYEPFFMPIRTDTLSILMDYFVPRKNLVSTIFQYAYISAHIHAMMDIPCYMMARSQKTNAVACTVILYTVLVLIPNLNYLTLFLCLHAYYGRNPAVIT